MKYGKLNKAAQSYGCHYRTILNWAKSGKIKTIKLPSGATQYRLPDNDTPKGIAIGYVRVSSYSQKQHLISQQELLSFQYPGLHIVSEVGSGLNFKRKKLWSIMEQVFKGDVEVVVVTHKDRLARFGFEFIERVCNHFGTKLVVLNKKETSPQEELVQDILAILHVFSSRLYGLRKYKQELKSLQNDSRQGSEESTKILDDSL